MNIAKNWPQFVCAIGGLLIVIGSFLPWLKAETPFEAVANSGVDRNGDGVTTLILGIVILLGSAFLFAKPKLLTLTPAYLVLACSLVVVIVGIMDYIDLNNTVDEISNGYIVGSVGVGIYLVITGGVLGMAGLFGIPKKPEKVTKRRKR